MKRMFKLFAFLPFFIVGLGDLAVAQTISLKANFHLLGEVNKFSSLGFGTMELEFGIDSLTLAEGSIQWTVGTFTACDNWRSGTYRLTGNKWF